MRMEELLIRGCPSQEFPDSPIFLFLVCFAQDFEHFADVVSTKKHTQGLIMY